MDVESLLGDLRQQRFYNGQILRVRHFEGRLAQTAPLEVLLDRVPRLARGSVAAILSVLGLRDVYAELIAGLAKAFPDPNEDGSDPHEDSVGVAPFSPIRELLWQLICLLEALDEGATNLILCPSSETANQAQRRVDDLLRRADLAYAVELACITQEADLSVFDSGLPRIVTTTPEMLRILLCDPGRAAARERLFSALGRVALPAMESWPTATASHSAHLMRQVHVECAMRGTRPALVATLTPDASTLTDTAGVSVQHYVSGFWGRSLPASAFVRADSVEAPPAVVINYSGGLIRNPQNPDEWIRQDPSRVASDLLGWLVGKFPDDAGSGVEVHYVLDVSGSMSERLAAVKPAVLRDLGLKLDSAALRQGDWVKLTLFQHEAHTVFDGQVGPALLADFTAALDAAESGGGTDVPLGLGTALASALAGAAQTIHVILFSDGGSPVANDQRRDLIRLVRAARSQGRTIRLLYVVLDMQPPPEVTNLVIALGGRIVERSTAELERGEGLETEGLAEGSVVVLSGENGIPESVVQRHLSGRRPLQFVRRASALSVPPAGVAAVVASGRFGSILEVLDDVRHLAHEHLPIFVLTEAEAWSRVLAEDLPELEMVGRLPAVWPNNPNVRLQRLREYVGQGEIEDFVFRYLDAGSIAYEDMLVGLGISSGVPNPRTLPPSAHEGFDSLERGRRRYVRASGQPTATAWSAMDTFTEDRIRLEGAGVRVHTDSVLAPFVFHPGALVDGMRAVAEVDRIALTVDVVPLRERTWDRVVPLLDHAVFTAIGPDAWSRSKATIETVGELQFGRAKLDISVVGIRIFERGDLDDKCRDERYGVARRASFETMALRWTPQDADGETTNGLANLLRLTLPAVLEHADQTVLIVPEGQDIWIADVAPGGNGIVDRFVRDRTLLPRLLLIGGRIALECPCEAGLAGCSDLASPAATNDSGCPRCTRALGAVLLDGAVERLRRVNKRTLLEWLLAHRHLPASAALHLKEKYEGIDDASRIFGEDRGSRRGCMKLTRRVIGDRLGVRIDDADVARFTWLTPEEMKKYLGLYRPADNLLSVAKGLREWLALDITAHEFFHNLQSKAEGLFNMQALGPGVSPALPFDGKIFLEGSAMWAESHVVDSLAVRSALTLANLRHGDEYGEGFRVLKYIEENHGGVGSVLQFLSSGDIGLATSGKIRDLGTLYSAAGLSIGQTS